MPTRTVDAGSIRQIVGRRYMKLRCFASLRRRLIAVAATGIMSILAGAPHASAQDGRGALAPLLAKAKQEGALTIFTGTARYPDSAVKQIEQDFRRKYGFALKITLAAPGPHPPIVQKLITEAKSGVKPGMDLFPTALAFYGPMREAGVLAKGNFAALGVPPDLIAPPGDNGKISTIARNLIYNTNLVQKPPAPPRLPNLPAP